MKYHNLIERNPDVMMGKPIIKGTRITVELIVRKIADGFTIPDILVGYPHLTEDGVKAALEFAADMISNEMDLQV